MSAQQITVNETLLNVTVSGDVINVSIPTAGAQGLPSTKKTIVVVPFASNETITVGDGTIGFSISSEFNGLSLTGVAINTPTPGTVSGTTDVQIRRLRAGTPTDLLSTKVSLAAGVYEAENGVITVGTKVVSTGDILFPDIDSVNGTPPTGLFVSITLE
jgi:hypothetical protein